MHSLSRFAQLLSLLMAVFLLSACGGGGSGNSTLTISDLRYNPASVLAGTDFAISGSFRFLNPSGRAFSIRLSDSDGSASTIPIPDSRGVSEGSIQVPPIPVAARSVGVYEFTIQLVDSAGATSNEISGSVTMTNGAPVAHAGASYAGTTGTILSLDGSASSDPNGDPLTYRWDNVERPGGSQIALSNQFSTVAAFVPDLDGEYRFKLTVFDGYDYSEPDFVTVMAIPSGRFSLQSHRDDVASIQGTPREIRLFSSTYQWYYGPLTRVVFSTNDDRVISWDNYDGSLMAVIVPGNNVTGSTSFSLGSHHDDVAFIQGTPQKINVFSSTYQWYYGTITHVEFSANDDRVISWNNYDGSLKLTE